MLRYFQITKGSGHRWNPVARSPCCDARFIHKKKMRKIFLHQLECVMLRGDSLSISSAGRAESDFSCAMHITRGDFSRRDFHSVRRGMRIHQSETSKAPPGVNNAPQRRNAQFKLGRMRAGFRASSWQKCSPKKNASLIDNLERLHC